MRAKYALISLTAILIAFAAIRCRRTTTPHPAIYHHNTVRGESTNSANSSNTSCFTAIPDNDMGQSNHGNARQKALSTRPVEKDGEFSVYFDYDRGLDAVDKPWPLSSEMALAETHGAPFKFSFLVVDENDAPVEDAEVAIVALNRQGSKVFSSHTGADGVASVEGFGTGEIHVEIDRSGFFHMSLWHWIFQPRLKCVSDGRWLPWDPLLKITLTEKPAICSAIAYKSEFALSDREGLYGFDLVSGVASSSTNCDMLISVKDDPTAVPGKYPWHCFDITFPGDGNGAQIVRKNLFSECQHPPIAPETGYTNCLSLSGWKPVADDECVIFKIRNSESKQPLYGVFRHSFISSAIGQDLRFDVVVNVEPGERTLLPARDHEPLTRFFSALKLGSLSEELVPGGREDP